MMLPRRRLRAVLHAAAVLTAVAVFAPHRASAQAAGPATRTPVECGGAPGISGTVASAIDGRSFRLADGREIRLAGIEAPALDRDGTTGGSALAARAALEALGHGAPVVLRSAAPSPDRYGRLVAYAFIAAPAGERLIQYDLLAGGYGLLSPVGLASGCRNLLRSAEHIARAAKLGLWADPDFGVQQADDPAEVLARQGRFTLVSGKVASVRESGGIMYVNFGRRWSDDFTVTILKRNERLFANAGMAPNRLAGHRIEVRGWIEERGGPAIEVARPEQIELVE